MGMIPGGSFANRSFCESAVTVADGVEPVLVDLLADAQTSGGLLIAVAEDRAEALHAALDRRGVPHPEIGLVREAGAGRIILGS
jgi:selenide,water dikinase